MKKILFCAAVAALATACTSEDDLVLNQEATGKGLTFDVSLAENAITKGELWKDENGTYPFFWYAEQDRIDVVALNAQAVTTGYGNNSGSKGVATGNGTWTLPANAASYKATKSEKYGLFTAASDADMLALPAYNATSAATKASTTVTIVATSGLTAKSVTSKVTNSNVVPGELTSLVVTTKESNATQTLARANAVDAPMYSVSQAKREDAYSALGEKANLSLIRPFPVVRFTTANTDDYIEYFGKLTSIELTALGATKSDGTKISASNLAYAKGADYTIIGATPGFAAGYEATTTPAKVTVNLTDGTWSDSKAVYMTVAPVSRKEFADAGVKEDLKVVYTFEHITFTLNASGKDAPDFEKAWETDNDWKAVDKNGDPNAVTAMPALDINNYNYLVVGSGADRTLIVIKGNFKDIYNSGATAVKWEGNTVACNQFKTIISNVELTTEELATLKGFTALESLTLKENTVIPANTFGTEQQTSLTVLNLPKVTEVKSKFIANSETATFSNLMTLIMPVYEFEKQAINNAFFNSTTKKSLKVLDMSGVRSMLPNFGIERTLKFEGYEKLTTVTVQDGVILAPSAFAGCKNLETVDGVVNIESAPEAFAMTSDAEANNALESIELSSGVITESAFAYCKALETVTCNGADVVPTEIGKKGFYHATALEYMDLSKVTKLGASAFASTGLISANKNTDILTVGATEIPDYVFANTKVRMVDFANANTIAGKQIFYGASELIQIRFKQVIKLADGKAAGYYADTFGTTASVDLWTNPAQPGVDGKNFTLSYEPTATTNATQSWTFASIQKKIE